MGNLSPRFALSCVIANLQEELLWNNIRVMLREVVRTGELYKQSPVL
jgi:hypothetical protein